MRKVISEYRHCNGAEHAIGGRGVLRRKLSTGKRVKLATDVALGLVIIEPSIAQAAALVGAPLHRVNAEIKRFDEKCQQRQKEAAVAAAETEAEIARVSRLVAEGWAEMQQEAIAKAQAEAELVNEQADAFVAIWRSTSRAAMLAAVQILESANQPA
jgi:hypothetical protein